MSPSTFVANMRNSNLLNGPVSTIDGLQFEHQNLHTVHRRSLHCLDGNAENLGHQQTDANVIDHLGQVTLLTKTSDMLPNRSVTSGKRSTCQKPHQVVKSLELVEYPRHAATIFQGLSFFPYDFELHAFLSQGSLR
jgi:hypothetical protein